jgi:hypothetical protein
MVLRGQFVPGPSKKQPKQWRDFYTAALRANGDVVLRQLQVSVAMTLCISRLLEISPERSSEREELSISLNDLKILGRLHRKYD